MIKIYGERNTGTNYLSKLINLNLHAIQIEGIAPQKILKLQKLAPGKELIRDLYFQLSFNKNLGWKHSCINSYKLKNSILYKKNSPAIITLTKNPYAWLLSLYRNPYHQHYRKKPDFKTFLLQPWKTVLRDKLQSNLENPIELWNQKNSSYIQDDYLNLTSESIIKNPEAIIDEISQKFNIQKKNNHFINYHQSTKERKKDNNYYLDYYQNEKWQQELNDEIIYIINQSLDKKVLKHFGYRLLSSSLE